MKAHTKLVLLLTLGLSLAGAGAFAQSDNGAPPPGQPPGRRPPPIGQVLLELLNKYDANHDGTLDQTEMAALKQDIQDGKIQPRGGPPRLPKEILEKYDLNHDGVLDESERAALRQDVEAGKVQLPPPGGRPRLAAGPGPGAPSAKQLLAKYDTNHDGVLDENELAILLQDLPRHHRPMHRGPGAPSGPGAEPAAPIPAPQQ